MRRGNAISHLIVSVQSDGSRGTPEICRVANVCVDGGDCSELRLPQ